MGKAHKAIIEFETDFLNQLKQDKNACVEVQKHKHHLALHPYHLSSISSSIKSILGKQITKYDKKLSAILLGFENVKLLSATGAINFDSCFIHVDIEADFFLFKPEVGQQLRGVVNKKSEGHVSCLVHKAFIVALPKPENPENEWLGDAVKIGSEILFRVTLADFEGRLPYIKGELLAVISEADSGISTSEENGAENTKKSKKIAFERSSSESETIPKPSADPVDSAKSASKSRSKSYSESSQEEIVNDILLNVEKEIYLGKRDRKSSVSVSSLKRKSEFIEPAVIKKKKARKSSVSSQSGDELKEELHVPGELYDSSDYFEGKKDKKSKKDTSRLVDDFIKEQLIEEQLKEAISKPKKKNSSKKKTKQDAEEALRQQLIKQELSLMSDDSTKSKRKEKKMKVRKLIDTSSEKVEDLQARLLQEQLQAIAGKKIKIKQEKISDDDDNNNNNNTKAKKSKNQKIKIKKEATGSGNCEDDEISLPELNLEELFNPTNIKDTAKFHNYQMADEEDRKGSVKKIKPLPSGKMWLETDLNLHDSDLDEILKKKKLKKRPSSLFEDDSVSKKSKKIKRERLESEEDVKPPKKKKKTAMQ